jgi:hypothetical protein
VFVCGSMYSSLEINITSSSDKYNFKEGCVIVKNDEVLGKMLVAYVTVINNQDINGKEVISHLERILFYYAR